MAATPEHETYWGLVPQYDRLTRAAYEVMGRRWRRFQEANASFVAARRGSAEFHELGARAYRLGLRSTHAYFLWTKGHTALVAAQVVESREAAA